MVVRSVSASVNEYAAATPATRSAYQQWAAGLGGIHSPGRLSDLDWFKVRDVATRLSGSLAKCFRVSSSHAYAPWSHAAESGKMWSTSILALGMRLWLYGSNSSVLSVVQWETLGD